MCVCVCLSVWVSFLHVFAESQTSSLSSVRLRMQLTPDGADSHFIRWLTALHVNNNIFITFKPLPNIFLYFSPTEDEDAKFVFILISIIVHLNE